MTMTGNVQYQLSWRIFRIAQESDHRLENKSRGESETSLSASLFIYTYTFFAVPLKIVSHRAYQVGLHLQLLFILIHLFVTRAHTCSYK